MYFCIFGLRVTDDHVSQWLVRDGTDLCGSARLAFIEEASPRSVKHYNMLPTFEGHDNQFFSGHGRRAGIKRGHEERGQSATLLVTIGTGFPRVTEAAPH